MHANSSSYWSSKLSLIRHYLWWRNSLQIHGVCNVCILDFCFVCLLPSETWRWLVSGQNLRCLMSWAQYTFDCSHTSKTCYFWYQFLAVCDTSLLSRSTCCVEKWPERSESIFNTRPCPLPGQLPAHYSLEYMHSQPRRPAQSQLCKLLGVHYRQKAYNNRLVGVGYSPASADNAPFLTDSVTYWPIMRFATPGSKYKLFCGGWFAVWLPPSATNYSSIGQQKNSL